MVIIGYIDFDFVCFVIHWFCHGDLPGVKKEDLHVELHDQLLTISGQKKTEKEEKNDKYHCVERSFGSFSRSFGLPEGVSERDIKADLWQ